MAIRKQKEKLLGWGGMGITTGDTEIVKRGRHEKVVVFSNCFTVEQVMKDPTIIFKEWSLHIMALLTELYHVALS